MAPLTAVRRWARSLIARPSSRQVQQSRSEVRQVTLRVEQLEERAAPSSLWSLDDWLGGQHWQTRALAEDALTADWFERHDQGRSVLNATSSGGSNAALSSSSAVQSPLFALGTVSQTSVPPATAQPAPWVADAGVELAKVGNSFGGGIRPPIQTLLTVSVQIVLPSAGATVTGNGNYSAFGYVSPNSATMTAWITVGGNTYNGTRIPPIPYNPLFQWGFRFTGIPTGNPVQLTVQGVASGSVGSQMITFTPV